MSFQPDFFATAGVTMTHQITIELYIFVLRLDRPSTFERKVVGFSAHNTNIYKICKLRKAIFSVFYNIAQPNPRV